VKVLDFGVAKQLAVPGAPGTAITSETQPGDLRGTPAYMAPEVLLAKEPDARADIFALGVVLYESLTGRHPFLSDTFVATSDRILHETPAAPGLANRSIPVGLDRVLGRMLAKDPAARYATAAELVSELHAIRSGVAPLPLRGRINRRIVLAAAVLAIAAVAVLFQILRSPPRAPAQPRWVLIADFENRTGDEFFDVTARELLTVAIEQSRFLTVFPRGRTVDTLLRMQKPVDARLDPATAREICLRENLQTFISGEVVPAAGGYRIAVRAVDPKSEVTLAALAEPLPGKQGLWNAVDRLSAELRENLGEERSIVKRDSVPLERATTQSLEALERFSRALDLQAEGKIDEARTLMKAAVEIDPEFALAHSRLAVYQSGLGAEEESLASSERAYRLRGRVSERERYHIEAIYHRVRLDYDAALQAFRALAVLYPTDPDAQKRLGENYAFGDHLSEAIESTRRASDLAPKDVTIRAQLIELLERANRADEALAEVRIARMNGEKGPALDEPEACALMMKGDFVHARQILQSILGGGGEYHENLARLDLAELSILEGKLVPAAKQLEADLTVDMKTAGGTYAAIRRYWLARVYLILGQKRLALVHLDGLLATKKLAPIHLHQLRQGGLALAEMGEVSRGQRVLQQLEQLQAQFPSSFTKAAVVQVRGALAGAAGKQAEAQRDLEQARVLWGGVLGAWSLALYWDQRGDHAKALDCYREVLARKGEVIAWDFPGLWVLAHPQAARCYKNLGNDREAARLYDEFLHLWGTEAKDIPQVKKAKEELKDLRPTKAGHKK
jgi:tetratricopeptide (TPR) repeat protein